MGLCDSRSESNAVHLSHVSGVFGFKYVFVTVRRDNDDYCCCYDFSIV